LFYDVEKARAGRFECTGCLPLPPESVLIAADDLTAECNNRRKDPLHEDIMKINARFPGLELYRSSGTDQRAVVHRGTVACGQVEILDAANRDRLAKAYKVLSFEAGVATAFEDLPCIVIQGISHYCDAQEQDKLHGYPAATATAYARQLLAHIAVDKNVRYVRRTLLLFVFCSLFFPCFFWKKRKDVSSKQMLLKLTPLGIVS
jgi:hypothetical protein